MSSASDRHVVAAQQTRMHATVDFAMQYIARYLQPDSQVLVRYINILSILLQSNKLRRRVAIAALTRSRHGLRAGPALTRYPPQVSGRAPWQWVPSSTIAR
jgi:hypothetical protein